MIKFAFKNLLTRKMKSIFTIIAITIASLIVLISYNVANQINEGIETTAAYYDVLVGPNGSSTDLVLSTMFFTENSLGTIDSSIYEELKNNKDVREAVPFATGDSYNGCKIIGTENSFLKTKKLKEGKLFENSFEVTIGSDVAKRFNLKIGDKIIGVHGLGESGHKHENNPYTIVGILDKTYTSYDNVIFTKVDSVWKSHAYHDEEEHADDTHNEIMAHEEHENGEYTAVLVKTKNPTAQSTVSKLMNEKIGIQAINPSTVLRDVLENVNFATKIVYVLCIIISIMAVIIIYMITLMMLEDIKKDVSLMRLLGLKRRTITGIILMQNMIVVVLGIILSFVLARVSLLFLNNITSSMGIVLNYLKVYKGEYLAMGVVALVSLLPMGMGLIKLFKKEISK